MKQRCFLQSVFTTPTRANYNARFDQTSAVEALPVESTKSRACLGVIIESALGILEDPVTVNHLLTDRIITEVLKRGDDAVFVVFYLLMRQQERPLSELEVFGRLLVLLGRWIEEKIVYL